jgi:hypothetical protein
MILFLTEVGNPLRQTEASIAGGCPHGLGQNLEYAFADRNGPDFEGYISETSSDHRSAVLKAITRIGLVYWAESRS